MKKLYFNKIEINYKNKDYIIDINSLLIDWELVSIEDKDGNDLQEEFETFLNYNDEFLDLIENEIEKKQKEAYYNALENNI